MLCTVCQAPVREAAHFCYRCGFPRTAADDLRPRAPEQAASGRDVAVVSPPAGSPVLAVGGLVAIRADLLLRFAAEVRLVVRLTERFLDADVPGEGVAARLAALRTQERLATVEQQFGIRPDAPALARRRAALVLKLELDEARLARWEELGRAGHPAADGALDALCAAIDRQATDLDDIRVRLAAASDRLPGRFV